MGYKEIIEKYEQILHRFEINCKIQTVAGPEYPVQKIEETDEMFVISLNTDDIAENEFEDFVSYNVRKVLLPRLRLETERLMLRRVQIEDAEAIFTDASDAYSSAMDSGGEPFTEMNEDFYDLVEELIHRKTQYSVVLKETQEVVGTIRLRNNESRQVEAMDIGYGIYPGYRRRGYAYEALSALLSLIQEELYLELVLAEAVKENEPSISLLKKLGFQREGFHRKGFWNAKRGPIDIECFYRDR